MEDKQAIYIGQFKTKGRYLKFNQIRYTTICLVLDYFCYMHSLATDVAQTKERLIEMVFKQSSFKKNRTNRIIVETTINNMIMMGLLMSDKDYVALDEGGKQAYISQTFHLAAASLYEASQSRRIAIIAVVVAIASVLLTMLPLVLPYLCKILH